MIFKKLEAEHKPTILRMLLLIKEMREIKY